MRQRHLIFLDIPSPNEAVWVQLDDEQRLDVIEVLSRLIAQTATPMNPPEESNDD